MPYDLGVIKRQRREPPVISTSTYGGNFVGFYSTGPNYYAVHVFTSSGQFTKPSYVTTTTAQVLVVAGGGGGASASSSGGSLYFNGVGGGASATKLTTPANPVFAFGTGDFTVEAWIYLPVTPSNLGQIIGGHNSGSNADWIFAVLVTTNYIAFYSTNGSTNITSVSGVPLITWTHVAMVMAGTIPKIYINGVLDKTGSAGQLSSIGNSTIITVGGDNTGNANSAFTGYITNLRVVKGLAVYSGNFTTPNYMLQSTQSANPGGGSNTQAISTASWTSLILDVLSPTGYIADTGGNTLPITNNASTVVYSSTPVPAFISAISGVGGGGGAGGLINSSTYSISTSLTILIGAGGAVNINGNASTVTNGVTVLTASGGGTGGSPLNNSGTAGGSGGGGSGTGTGGANTSTQGNVGGAGGSQTSYAGGGGGASTAGGAANSGGAGQGGSGTITLITGSPIWLAGGGGGGANATGYNNGSYGGGGNGGTTSVISGTAGLPYTGGGGGGGGASTGLGGNGGSGIVIISYAIPANLYPSIQSDPYFSNNALLLNGTTSTSGNAALITYSVFTDVSTYGSSISSNGSTATTLNSFDPGLYHGLYFSGSNYLTVGSNNVYNFIHSTTAIITLEFWVYPISLSSAPFIVSTNAGNSNYFGGSVQITSAGNIVFTISSGGVIFVVQATSSGTIPTNAWSHVAVTWNYAGNTGAFYINGNQSGTFTRGTGVGVAANSSLALTVGQSGSNSNFYTGHISNLRLVNGTVVYAASFLPSKEPLSTIQFAPSVNVATITSGTTALLGKFPTTSTNIADYSTLTSVLSNIGSVIASTLNPFTPLVNEGAYFNGSSQYLAIGVTGSIFELAGSSFTMECWVYIPTSGGGTIWTLGVNGIFAHSQAGVDGNGSVYFQTAIYQPSTYWYAGWNNMKAATPNSVVTNNTWAHIAFVRDSGTFKIFVNGTQQDSRAFLEPNANAYGTVFIGSYYGTSFFTGYISNFRLVRGLAVYSGNFTVPTGPLQVTQVSNPYGGSNTQAISTASYTSLLTLRYGTYGVSPSNFIDYGTNNNSIVVTGQPAQGSFSPFGNNWSTLFNGTTDYLSIPVIYSSSSATTALNFGSNDWTVESWVYLTASTGTAYIAGQLNANNIAPISLSINSNRPSFNLTNSGLSTSPSVTITAPNTLSTGTWNHIAAVRNVTRLSMYVNGVEQAYSFSSSPVFDLSINTATVVNTNVTYSTLSPYDQSQYHSLYFNGSSYLNLPANAGFNYSTGDFTWESWVYPITYGSGSGSMIIDFWNGGAGAYATGSCQFWTNNSGAVIFSYATSVSLSSSITTTATIPLNAWSHLAVVRLAGNITIYVNGIGNTPTAAATAIGSNTLVGSIGRYTAANGYFFNGYISNVRIVKGLALYSGSLVQVPQGPLSTIQSATLGGALANVTANTTQLLTGRFINPSRYFFDDYSPNNFVLTNNGGVAAANLYPPISSTSTFNSMYFNGSSQYLSVPYSTVFQFGTGDFTVECWFYATSIPGGFPALIGRWDSSLGRSWVLQFNATSIIWTTGAGTVSGGDNTLTASSLTIVAGTWYHIAVTRTGTTQYVFLNGTQVGTNSSSVNITGTPPLSIGVYGIPSSPLSYFPGYISNLRIVKGLAVYTGKFTVPSTQLTTTQFANQNGNNTQAITTGTSLLIVRTSSLITEGSIAVDYSVVPNYITSVGNTFTATNFAPPITSTSTYNSLLFNGSIQYLSIANATAFNYGSSDFTIEAWVYLNAVGLSQSIISTFYSGFSGSNGTGYEFLITTSNFLQFDTWTPNTEQLMTASNNALSANTWYHVAVVNNGGTFNLYVNGTQCTKNINITQAVNTNGSAAITVGYSLYSPYNHPMNGYISNLRIVKGVGVYTGAFTRPTQPLTTTQAANPYGGSNVQAISTGTYTSLLTLLPYTTNIVDYSTNTSVITIGSGTVSLSTLDPFAAYTTNFNSIYLGGNGSLAATSSLSYAAGSLLFNGSSQYLTVPSDVKFQFGTGDWTIETWFYLNSTSGSVIIDMRNGITLNAGPMILVSTSLAYSVANTNTITGTTTLSTGIWYHVAVVKSSGSTKMYLNGIQEGSTYSDSNTYVLNGPVIGKFSGSGATAYFGGYMTNLRLVKGTAVYTSNFTPTVPLSNIANTSLLLLVNSDANKTVDSSSTPLTVTNNGATYSSSVIPSSGAGWLNYGDHTVEAWVNLNKLSNNPMLIAGTYDGVNTTGWEWSMNNYWMTLGYRLNGVLTSVDTLHDYPTQSLTQLTTDQGGLSLTPTNNSLTSTFSGPISGYYGSLNFAGGGQYLSAPYSTQAFGMAGDFTIEMWIFPTSYQGSLLHGRMVFSNGGQSAPDTDGYSLIIGATGLFIQTRQTNGIYSGPSTGPAALYTWNHIAYVRYNGNHQLYLNGVSGNYTGYQISGSLGNASYPFYIGRESVSIVQYNDTFQGYISNVRVVNGVAVYTGNFTPPTGNLSSTQGAGTNIQAILTASYTSLLIGISTASLTTVFSPNTWNHLAFTRSGTTATMYVNGVRTTSTVISNYTEQSNLRIGYIGFSTATSTYLTGYISNFRIVSGVAVYTGTNFVPPTGLLTTQQPTNPYGGTNTNAITFNTSTRILTAEFNGVNISLFSTTTNMLIGRAGSAVTSMFPGYLSNLRIVNGTALYTSAFAPPRAPLPRITNTSLLISASNTFVDKSVNNFIVSTGTAISIPNVTKFTPYKIPGEYNKSMVGGSVYFNTSTAGSQNLSLGAASTLALGSGNYTVECWVYLQSYNPNASTILDWRGSTGGTTAGIPDFYLNAAGLVVWANTGGTNLLTSPNAIPLNTWNHIAMVRYNSILYMYINGVEVASIADSTTLTITSLVINNSIVSTNYTLFGYISNVRILVGRAIYTPTISVSTTTLTTVTNTVLLALQNDSSVLKDNSTNNFVLTKPNTSTVFQQILSPFGGQGSAYFNGVNNYLTITTGTNQAFNFGLGDFTLEAWVYPTARNGTYGSLIIGPVNYPSTIDWIWMINSTGYLYVQLGAATVGSGVITSTSQVPLSQWSHVACVRLYGLMTLYINGRSVGNNITNLTNQSAAGSLSFNGTNQYLTAGVASNWTFLHDGTTNYTAECWFYTNSTGYQNLFDTATFTGDIGFEFSINYPGAGQITLVIYRGVGSTAAINIITVASLFTTGTWNHVAATFVSSTKTTNIFVNGSSVSPNTGYTYAYTPGLSNTFNASAPLHQLYIGGQSYFNGYITNARITKSIVYTENFSPTVPLSNLANTSLLLLVSSDANKIIDSSTSPFTLTNVNGATYNNSIVPTVIVTSLGSTVSTTYAAGSLYFNGTSATLTSPSNAAFNLAANDFTLEMWAYCSSGGYVLNRQDGPSPSRSWGLYIGGGGASFNWSNNGTFSSGGTYSTTVTLNILNAWTHVAFVRNGNVYTFYVNGVASGSGAMAGTVYDIGSLTIGSETNIPGRTYFGGYLTNIRIINGTGLYTNNFTTTVPLANVANTKLLLLVNSSGAATTDSSSTPLTMTNNGATYSSIVPSVTILSGSIATATNTINVGIGAAINASAATIFNGYITNLNVIKGTGKYTGSFTPPTSDLNTVTNTALLTLLSTDTTFIDRSLNSFAITNSTTATTFQGFSPYTTSSWSTYFDGSTYMYVSNATPLILTSSTNWTIETWVNPTGNYAVNNVLFAKRNTGLTFKSMSFNGSTQYLSVSTSTGAFVFGSNDWTIECWFYTNSAATSQAIVGRGPSDADDELLILLNAGAYYVDWGNTSEWWQSVAGAYTANQWTHLAVVRYSNSLYVYSNGVSVAQALSGGGTVIISRALTNNYPFRIGQGRSNTFYFNGNISNFRVVNGLAVYTGNFNPPTGLLSTSQITNPFGGINTQVISTSNTTLLIGQFNISNSIADLSVNNSVVTNNNTVVPALTGPTFYNSIQFNGTNQYLTAPVGASTFGTGDFTVECWFYKTAATTCGILDNATGNADNNYWSLATYADGHCQFQIRDSSGQAFVIGSIITAINTWVYVAVTRQSGLVKLFVNGVLDNSATITKAITARITNIGSFQYTGFVDYFTGYISNVKLLTGLSIYNTTTSFAAPTAPLSKYIPTTGASVAGLYSLSLNIGTVVDFTTSTYATGTGDFTAECWVWMDPSSNGNAGFMTSVSASISGFMICRDVVGLVPANGSGPGDYFAWTVPTSSWTHVALTLRSGQVQAWLNGVSAGSAITRTNVSPAGTTIRLGGRYTSDTSYPFLGYISNARFVVGVGVYTGAFTVPTTQLQTTQPSGANIQAISNARSVQLLTAQTPSIADFSTTATSVAVTGNVVTTNYSGYIPTLLAPTYSLLINSSYLSIPADAAFQFGTGDFTIECWFYWGITPPTNTTQYTLISNLVSNNNTTWDLQYYNGNWRFSSWSPIFLQGSGGAIANGNTWYHIAVTRAAGLGQIWVNGTSILTDAVAVSFATDLSAIQATRVGWNGNNAYWPGYISNVRVVKGFAVYTGSFTPPTSMLRSTQVGSGNIQSISTASLVSLLVGQSNIIIDNSKNNFSITNNGAGVSVTNVASPFATAAIYDASYTTLLTANFIGTATSITDNSNNNYSMSLNNSPPISILSPFGVVYATTSTSYQGYLSSSTGYLGFYNGTTFSTSTTALSTGTWNHVAYTYDGRVSQGTVNIYVNGFRILQTTSTIRADAGENLHIGGVYGINENFYGYMSNFRIVKDSSMYLGSYFGVPNSKLNITTNTIPYPLTSTISTSLLTLQDNRIVDNSTNAYSLTLSGTPKTITFSPFANNPNISAYFNGTSDFINVQAQAALSLGTGDFTIEVWVYPTAVPTAYAPVIEARAAVAATPWVVGLRPSGGVLKTDFFDGTARTAATTIQLNVWTHLAWSRTNSILRMFVNGQIDYTLANYTTNLPAQTTNQFIGKIWDGANSYFQGYMSNLRVVKGNSLYTGNFLPSQIPLNQVPGGTTNVLTTFVDTKMIDYSGNTAIRSTTSTFNLTNATPKYNLYSMNFNGTTDFLTVSSSTSFVYNSNDFTWEMWVYPTSPIWATTSTFFIEHGLYGGSLRYANNKVFYSNITTATSTSSVTLSINSSTWTHLAVVRASNVTSVFINGAFNASTPDSYNYSVTPIVTVGNTSSSTYVNNYFQGYIEDLRITKGIARYLTTFVPPTKLSNR